MKHKALGVIFLVLALLVASQSSATAQLEQEEAAQEETAEEETGGPGTLADERVEEIEQLDAFSSEPLETPPAIETYGAEGPIVRSDLPEWLQDRVSDEAIALASRAELNAARATWDEDLDFVDQVDYQLEFRQTFGFDTSPDHIGEILAAKVETEFGRDGLGLYLTAEESQSMAERERLSQILDNLDADLLGGAENIARLEQSHSNRGRLHFYVENQQNVDRRALNNLVGPGNFRVIRVAHTLEDLEQYQLLLNERLAGAGVEFGSEVIFDGDDAVVRIYLAEGVRLTGPFRRGIPGNAIDIVSASIIDTHEDRNHTWDDLAPGQTIYVEDGSAGWCTWGANGHTNSYNYLVTAGHCFVDHENSGAGSAYGSSGFRIRNGSQQLSQVYKTLTSTGWNYVYARNTSYIDGARVTSAYADTNSYHKQGGFGFIQNRASHNSWEIGDMVCASLGRTRTFRCGVVQSENYTWNPAGPFNSSRLVRLSIAVDPGDSGAGVVGVVGGYPTTSNNLTLDGIIKAQLNVTLWPDSSLMVTAYDVKRGLGFDFNCATSRVERSAGNWGACPVVNR